MRHKSRIFLLTAALMVCLFATGPFASWAQDSPTSTMQILHAKIKADKKLLVAMNMELTESEAEKFWPIYEAYQKDLDAVNVRLSKMIADYARDYQEGNFSDQKAGKLMSELAAILKADAGLVESYAPKLSKAVPPLKAARYLQIENKIRAAVRYELSDSIPLIQ